MKLAKPFSPWPFAVVGLLVANAALAFFALYMSRSDGGAQVVDDYYRQAVAWDSVAAARNETAQSGWRLTVLDPVSSDSTLRIRVTDAVGSPVSDLAGTLTVRRPHLTAPLSTSRVFADAADGVYVAPVRLVEPGLHDLDFELTNGRTRFRPTVRFDYRASTR